MRHRPKRSTKTTDGSLLPGFSARAMADDPPDAGKIWASCTEHLPKGAVRPEMTEVFPAQGLSGYAAELQISVVHGKGETVLPDGLRIAPVEAAGLDARVRGERLSLAEYAKLAVLVAEKLSN